MSSGVIYMDYQATAPCDQRVVEEMLPFFLEDFGNPHSGHVMGRKAKDAIEDARKKIADLIKANDSKEIIFTSGATESNNLAIQGVTRSNKTKGNRVVTSAVEHKCVLETFQALKRDGFDVVVVPVLPNGIVDMQILKDSVNDKTILVSIMTVNNEIGVIQPIEQISEICKRNHVLFHSDAAQAVGKIDVDASQVDLMSVSGHKIYGPKGVGALYVRLNLQSQLSPLFYGGGQERGLRSGTLPTPLCVGLGKACAIAQEEMRSESKRLAEFRDYFLKKIFDNLSKVHLNGDAKCCIPGCINLSFEGVEGEGIMLGMPNVCISSGSACTSDLLQPSYVLEALSIREDLAHSSLRIGFGRFTTFEEVNYASSKIIEVVNRLRAMSPLW
ncbi:MAG: aminotransferase class V-fold PLP-dependent enzyme [Holosporaceae bacterium]|jgi:cysteine desulfurase|nr:aminotransferase class V-fold PLP-dependent enzyme [Holosporaceae bacterium]